MNMERITPLLSELPAWDGAPGLRHFDVTASQAMRGGPFARARRSQLRRTRGSGSGSVCRKPRKRDPSAGVSMAVIASPFRLLPCTPRTAQTASFRAGMPTIPIPGNSRQDGASHVRRLYSAKRFKDLAKIAPLSYHRADCLHRYPFCVPFLCIKHLSLEDVPNKKNEFGRRVLRPARLSVTNDLASRLHQAIILSSEQHATNRGSTTPCRTCKFILLCLQNIF